MLITILANESQWYSCWYESLGSNVTAIITLYRYFKENQEINSAIITRETYS